jgi:hypothetical protein
VATLPKDKSIDVKGHRVAMKQALGTTFVESCESQVSVAELQCSLRARDLASVTACETSK